MNRSLVGIVVLLVSMIVIILMVSVPTGQVEAQTVERCFAETGFCISGPIRQFWERNGGVLVFGLPLSAQESEYIGLVNSEVSNEPWLRGLILQSQRFERARLELHPDGQVRLGRLGSDILEQQGRSWWEFEGPGPGPHPGCLFFEETGHNVCGNILQAWQANGIETDGVPGSSYAESLALFGLPLGEARMECCSGGSGVCWRPPNASNPSSCSVANGNWYLVQWFERARFEYRPGTGTPFDVQFGRLGAQDTCVNIPVPIGVDLIPGTCLRRTEEDKNGFSFQVERGIFPPRGEFSLWYVDPLGDVYEPQKGKRYRMDASGGSNVIGPLGVEYTFGHVGYIILQGVGFDPDYSNFAIFYYKGFEPEFWYEQVAAFGQSLNPCAGLPIPARAIVRTVDAAGETSNDRFFACAPEGVEAVEIEAGGFRTEDEVWVYVIAPNGEFLSKSEMSDILTLNEDGRLQSDEHGKLKLSSGSFPRFRKGRAIASHGAGTYVVGFQGTKEHENTGARPLSIIPIKIVDAPGSIPPIIILKNGSESLHIREVYMTVSGNDFWGGNLLASNQTIAPGKPWLFELAVDPEQTGAIYDLMVVDSNGNKYKELNVELEEGEVYRFTWRP